ncbi:hypothetical protein [Falsibacillus pallidus]|uniref:Uncharacterized protein n=1 Tax=Falsibacillus pallidus TaxID=493781 RepID=A0A370G0F7_9BACI|nr:hypothetical protein [Falsibacillus pallidus]RDI37238.1 hypothetical protein DFR59_12228 [Falsibacillus pallidus]
MSEVDYEKQQMKKLTNYIYVSLSALFTFSFLIMSTVILYFPMVGILDFPYFPSKAAIASFFLAFIFSLLALRRLPGKILLVFNICLMLFMIFYGP